MFTNHSRYRHFKLKPSLSVVTLHANLNTSSSRLMEKLKLISYVKARSLVSALHFF